MTEFQKGDLIRFIQGAARTWPANMTFIFDHLEKGVVYCTPTAPVSFTATGVPYTGLNGYMYPHQIESALTVEEIVQEHLTDPSKHKDAFQRILINLKHSA